MRKILFYTLLPLIMVVFAFNARAQSSTSKGTEFWTAYMYHINGVGNNNPSKMGLYITSDVSTTGSVAFVDGSPTLNFTVAPNAVTFVQIPASEFLSAGGQFLKGIHITAAKPVAVYAHIYASSVSGATLLLPVNTLGKNYYSLNYTQIANMASFSIFNVIATEDDTEVDITPTAALTTPARAANQTFHISLKKGELYQGLSTTDLTGTKIASVSSTGAACKKIAVFSGSGKIGIGCSAASSLTSDNLFQQVYPTSAWGKNYVTVALKDRLYDVFRIVRSDPTTNVTLNGSPIASGQFTGMFYEFNTNTTHSVTNVISADKPIQVIQYTPTQNQTLNVPCTTGSGDVGDPEMIFLNPIEQGLSHVTLYSTGYYDILQSYINVVLPKEAVSSFTLDGLPYTAFSPVTNDPRYYYAQIPVNSGPNDPATGASPVLPTAGTHNISASMPFNAIAYGFGQNESYGYAAGTNLQDLNEYISLQNPQTNQSTTSGCTGVSYRPQVRLPYQTTSIQWDLKDGSTPITVVNPQYDHTEVKGTQTLYVYNYPQDIPYTKQGDYTIVATIFNPTSDDCGSSQEIQLDFTVSDPPITTFAKTNNPCIGSSNTFTDKSTTNGSPIKSWLWDLGDGQTATTAIVNHTYAKAGDYKVQLTVTNDNGCTSMSAVQNVHIVDLPVANFNYASPDCETRILTFTDASTTPEGTLTTWIWDFGDGAAPETKSDNKPVPHQYAAAGTYTVTVKVTGSTTCSSAAFSKDIVIHPLPVVDFMLPDACVKDVSMFTSTSTIADHTESEFTYLWNFGDGSATLANNVSASAIGKHKYPAAGTYNVTLTITSKYGCAVTSAPKAFVVNGDTPVASFIPDPANIYCSSDVVKFIDQSSVNFGKITKIAMIYDLAGHPADTIFYVKGDVMQHQYPKFSSPLTPQQYRVEMIAYSGGSCISVPHYEDIQIKYNPDIAVPWPAAALCQESGPQIIVPNLKGFIGNATFSGTGITAAGVFDPIKSGPGTFTISFMFTAENTCTYFDSHDITVNPTPTASAGPGIGLLEGGSVTIEATAGSNAVSYQWTLANGDKATGLNRDDILRPTASPSADTEYMLTVKTAAGCTKSSNVKITVLSAPVVANTFTPNNDGVNDTWQIKYLDTYLNCSVDVYNRYGEKVYSSIGYAVPWDGIYKGTYLPVGTYYYIINPRNGRKVITGSITIIR